MYIQYHTVVMHRGGSLRGKFTKGKDWILTVTSHLDLCSFLVKRSPVFTFNFKASSHSRSARWGFYIWWERRIYKPVKQGFPNLGKFKTHGLQLQVAQVGKPAIKAGLFCRHDIPHSTWCLSNWKHVIVKTEKNNGFNWPLVTLKVTKTGMLKTSTESEKAVKICHTIKEVVAKILKYSCSK